MPLFLTIRQDRQFQRLGDLVAGDGIGEHVGTVADAADGEPLAVGELCAEGCRQMPQPSPPRMRVCRRSGWAAIRSSRPARCPSSPKITARSSMISEMQRLIHSALIGLAPIALERDVRHRLAARGRSAR